MTWSAHEVYDSFQVIPDNDLKPHSFFLLRMPSRICGWHFYS